MNIGIDKNYTISHRSNLDCKIKNLSKRQKFIYHAKGATGAGCALVGLYGVINKQTVLATLGVTLAAFWMSTMNKK